MSTVHAFGITHQGAVRAGNEDHILIGDTILGTGSQLLEMKNGDLSTGNGMLLAVADGIGGAEGGAVASRKALEVFRNHLLEASAKHSDIDTAIEAAGEHANLVLLDMADQESELYGMGCTLCGVFLNPPEMQVFNCGDSRAYRFRDGFLKRLTEDHTLGSEAVREGRLSAAGASGSPLNHELTNHLGLASCRMVIEKGPNLRSADVLLACSDGLYDLVDEATIVDLVSDTDASLKRIGEKLVDCAIANGGHDNISIILARVSD